MAEDTILYNRFVELANRAYEKNIYTFSDFLGITDQDVFYQASREFPHIHYELYGGNDICERKMVRFGSQEDFGYHVDFPIVCIKVEPLAAKFAKEYTHRDYLGSLMNLGMERKMFGDIFVDGMTAYIYASESTAEYVMDNMSSVGRNAVKCSVSALPEEYMQRRKQEVMIQCSAPRVDAVIAKVFNLSRKDVIPYFMEKKVAVNGRIVENNDKQLTVGDVVSVRGFGKFDVAKLMGLSKKGKQNIAINKYQ